MKLKIRCLREIKDIERIDMIYRDVPKDLVAHRGIVICEYSESVNWFEHVIHTSNWGEIIPRIALYEQIKTSILGSAQVDAKNIFGGDSRIIINILSGYILSHVYGGKHKIAITTPKFMEFLKTREKFVKWVMHPCSLRITRSIDRPYDSIQDWKELINMESMYNKKTRSWELRRVI